MTPKNPATAVSLRKETILPIKSVAARVGSGTPKGASGNLQPGCGRQEYRRSVGRPEIHQGEENVIIFPAAADRIGESTGEIRTRLRFGGLLKFYYRDAA